MWKYGSLYKAKSSVDCRAEFNRACKVNIFIFNELKRNLTTFPGHYFMYLLKQAVKRTISLKILCFDSKLCFFCKLPTLEIMTINLKYIIGTYPTGYYIRFIYVQRMYVGRVEACWASNLIKREFFS